MVDLISRAALLEFAHNHVNGTVDCNDIARFPAVDAEPVRHGYWKPVMLKDVFGRDFVYRHACSICHECALHECANYDPEEELSAYCPNCGAKMDAEVNDHGSDSTEHVH